MNPFDIVGQLSTSTKNNWEEIGDKDYNPFMINKAFSYHTDTLMLANYMNTHHRSPKQWQYDFYRLQIKDKRKRFSKWQKPEKDKLTEELMDAYKINRIRAVQYLALMSPADIKVFKEKTEKGGR